VIELFDTHKEIISIQWRRNPMKRKLIIFLMPGFFLFLFTTAVSQNKGAENILLQGGKLGSVPFSHHLHQKLLGDCNICHTLFPQVAGSIEKLKAEEKVKKKEAMDQCVECHKKGATTGSKAAPTKCSECHKR
jgi:cytochrome c-type protein NrfB